MLNSKYNVILASYPKSGNTWLRFILSHLYLTEDVDINFANIETLIPGIIQPWKLLFKKKWLNPQVFKSHSPYADSNGRYRNIYIIRDPRDVYLSYYHFLDGDKDLSYFPWFMDNYGFPYGRWSEHVLSWLKYKDEAHVVIVKYENFLENPNAELERIMTKLSLPSTEEKRAQAINNSSFDKMKNNAQQTYRSGNAPFIRKGISGEWKDAFTSEAQETFCKYEDVSLMEELGYPPF